MTDHAPNTPELERAAEVIAQADSLIVAAGAGIGVDSGLPDFRGNDGFWRTYPALARANVDFYAIASPAAFRSDPLRAWGFYGHRLQLYRDTRPHAGFEILRKWGERMPNGHAVFTSNVDGQFQKAGFDHGLVYECHGSIHYLQCLEPCSDAIWSADDLVPEIDAAACRWVNDAPLCPRCRDLARPNVLMFGDDGWIASRSQAQARRLERWLESVSRPVIIELGAGTAIASVRYFSEHVARERGGTLVRINLREAQVSASTDIGLEMGALTALTAIEQAFQRRQA